MIYDPMALVMVRSFFNPKEFSASICFAAEWEGAEHMRPRQFAIIAAGLCGSVIFAGCVIVGVSRFDLADIKNIHAQPIEDRAIEIRESISEPASAAGPMTDIAQLRESSRPEATFAEIAAVSMPDFVHADAGESLSPAEAPDESLPNSSRALARNPTRADRGGGECR
jgi:hypothetical protein